MARSALARDRGAIGGALRPGEVEALGVDASPVAAEEPAQGLGVLQRAAFGPREVASTRALAGLKPLSDPSDPQAPFVVRLRDWLRDNL